MEVEYIPCERVSPVPGDQPHRRKHWLVKLQICEIPLLSRAARCCHQCSSCDVWHWVTLLTSKWLCPLDNGNLRHPQSHPCTLILGSLAEFALCSGKKWFFSTSSEICRSCAPQPAKGGKLWEVKGQSGSMALFLEYQLWDSLGHISVLYRCPGHWAQRQQLLPTPAGMPAESLCSPSWREYHPHPDSSPLQAEFYHEHPVVGLHPWLSSALFPSHFPSLLPLAHL